MGYPHETYDHFQRDRAPVPTFKDGTISAFRTYEINDPNDGPSNTKIVQHNLDLSKGTSGSAIFDVNGFVVAINNAGIDRYVYDLSSNSWVWLDSGNVGWSVRVDELWSLIDLVGTSSKFQVVASAAPALPKYEAFPENWDGTTVAPSTVME